MHPQDADSEEAACANIVSAGDFYRLNRDQLLIIKWLSADLDGIEDPEISRKVGLINAFSLVGIGVLSIYGAHYLIGGRTTMGLLEIGIALSFALVALRLRTTRAPGFACVYSTSILGLFFLYLIVLCGPDHALWAFVFPLVALFLLGYRAGIAAILLYFAAISGFFLLDLAPPFKRYDITFEARFLGCLTTVSLIAFFFEILRTRSQQASREKNEDLKITVNALDAATAALRESETKYRDVVERASDGILIVQEQLICFANSQLVRLSGFTQDEIVGSDFTEFLHEDEFQVTLKRYRDRLEGRPTPRIYDSALKHRDGHRVEVEINSGLITYEGRPAVLALIRDITGRRRVEAEKAQLEEQLRQSQKMEAVGELAGGVAHDFNNMLTAISGFSQMILRRVGEDDPTLSDYAQTIREASKRAAELTAKLLAFARKDPLEVAPVDLHLVIRDVVKLLERTIDPRVRIHQDLKATQATVLGDRSQLQNTILNLAVNARDAMLNGGILTFRTSILEEYERYTTPVPADLEPENHLLITVADTGIGMDAETRDRAFEPFFTTKDTGRGTGLGLASAYGTVKAHRGSITLTSHPGRGSTFKLYLPLAIETADVHDEATAEIGFGEGRILVVDDEAPIRELYTAMLEEIGFEVVCTVDGREGVDYYREHQGEIDLAIVDLIMPRLSGRECVEALKLLDPGLPIVVSSGYSIDEEVRRVMAAGANTFIRKPFTMDELARTVTANLRPVAM